MLSRLLPAPTLNIDVFEDGAIKTVGTISANRRIASNISKTALSQAIRINKDVKDADDPIDLLENGHQTLDVLLSLEKQLTQHALDILEASEVLNGKPPMRHEHIEPTRQDDLAFLDQLAVLEARKNDNLTCYRSARQLIYSILKNTVQMRAVNIRRGMGDRITTYSLTYDELADFAPWAADLPEFGNITIDEVIDGIEQAALHLANTKFNGVAVVQCQFAPRLAFCVSKELLEYVPFEQPGLASSIS